jgi:hypothetical protein
MVKTIMELSQIFLSQNNLFFSMIVLLFVSSIIITRLINPYIFATVTIIGYFLYQKYQSQVVILNQQQTQYRRWIKSFSIQNRKVLLLYMTITEHLHALHKYFDKENDLFIESLQQWIVFCEEHRKFINGEVNITQSFIEYIVDTQKNAINLLLSLRYRLKETYLPKFDKQIKSLYEHTRSLLSEIMSNSKFLHNEFEISPLNQWDNEYSQHWKIL